MISANGVSQHSHPRVLVPIVVFLAFIAPLSIDIVLPASKLINEELGVGLQSVQSGLPIYLMAFAFAGLLHGSLADAFGRKPVAIIALGAYIVGTFVCATATSVFDLQSGRLIQGCSAGAGVVIGRAIINDVFRGVAAKQRLAIVSMMLSVPPALAPIVGGWISYHFGWREIFYVLAALATALLLICIKFLPETLCKNQRRPLRAFSFIQSIFELLKDRRFVALTGSATALLAGQFVFIAGSTAILVDYYGQSEIDYWKLFLPITFGVFGGGLAARLLVGKLSNSMYFTVGLLICLASSVTDIYISVATSSIHYWTFFPSCCYAFGMVMLLPLLYGIPLSNRPDISGIVSALQIFFQFVAVSLIAGVTGELASGSVLSMSAFKLACVILSVIIVCFNRKF